MSLRDDDPQLREFVDGLRAMGLEISLKHYRYHDGRELGTLPEEGFELSVDGVARVADYAKHFGGKKR